MPFLALNFAHFKNKTLKQQQQKRGNESEQLLQHMQTCEKLISNCSMDRFSDLRFELKQVKEKLRLLNQWNRLK